LTGRNLQRLAVAGFIDREDWQWLLFHPRSFAETVRGGNSNPSLPLGRFRSSGGLEQ
jgi:hypothetical protein